MKEHVLSLMYNDVFPGLRCPTAGEMPSEVTFVLVYVEPEDGRFFWAALSYGNRVGCRLASFLVCEFA